MPLTHLTTVFTHLTTVPVILPLSQREFSHVIRVVSVLGGWLSLVWLSLLGSLTFHRLVGPVVKASASGVAGPGSNPAPPHGAFSRASHSSDLNMGTLVAV